MQPSKQPVHDARLPVDEDLDRLRCSAADTSLVPVVALVLGEPALDQLRQYGVGRALAKRRCRRRERRRADHEADALVLVASYGGRRLRDAPELKLAGSQRVVVATQCELLLCKPLGLLCLLRLESDTLKCQLV